MITGKKEFLTKISGCLGRETARKPAKLVYPHQMQNEYLAGADREELLAAFMKNAEAVGIEVRICAADSLDETLVEIVGGFGPPVIIADEPLLAGAAGLLKDKFADQCHVWNPAEGREVNMGRAAGAVVGIAAAELALAESATSVLFSHLGSGRSVTLLPENSVIVIRAASIRPRLTQAMEWLGEQKKLPSSVNLVSGPSSTADIELVRVQGVHGPLQVVYVVIS